MHNSWNQPKASGWVCFVKFVVWMQYAHLLVIWFIEINGYKHQSGAWFDRGLASGSGLECLANGWATSHLIKVNIKNCILRLLNAMRRAYRYYHFLFLSFSWGLMAHLATNLSDFGWAKLRFCSSSLHLEQKIWVIADDETFVTWKR